MYGKLFESTFTGSMCGKGAVTFAVWCYAIAHTQTDSLVEINPIIVAAIIGCEISEVEAALQVLCSEDAGSRTELEGGRRLIEEGRFLYRTVNWAKYNGIVNHAQRREYNRLAQQKCRAKKALSSADSADSQQMSPSEAEAEAEAEAEKLRSSSAVSLDTSSSERGTVLKNGRMRKAVSEAAAALGKGPK